ncbi:MAG: hypothetical protein ACOY82_07075 [Pseudomonadota bacterium]
MLKRILPLLLSSWAPIALAFPPCPQQPLEVDPVEGPVSEIADPRYQTWYAFAGDQTVLALINPQPPGDHGLPGTGNCRTSDLIPLPGLNVSSPTVGLSPPTAPLSAFGTLALPDFRGFAPGTGMTYRLDFAIGDAALDAPGDWVDTIELAFYWDAWPNGSGLPSARYRVRIEKTASGASVARIIEARALWNTVGDTAPTSETVVATLPLGSAETTPMALRWHQVVLLPADDGGGFDPPPGANQVFASDGIDPASSLAAESLATESLPASTGTDTYEQYLDPNNVDATLEVLGPNNQVLYSVSLTGQWANGLSIGLLNYHTPTASPESWDASVLVDDARLRIEY